MLLFSHVSCQVPIRASVLIIPTSIGIVVKELERG